MSKEAQANGYPAPHILIVLDTPVIVRRKKLRGDIVKWYLDDGEILRRLGKDDVSKALVREDYRRAIDSNPVWKHGFFDIEGVVSNQRFNGRKNVYSYVFKYMAKCLTKDHCDFTSSLRTIKDVKDHNLLVALYTHLCNKCFRNRDITYGKGFKERIDLLSKQKKERDGPSPWTYLGLVDESECTARFRRVVPEEPYVPKEEALRRSPSTQRHSPQIRFLPPGMSCFGDSHSGEAGKATNRQIDTIPSAQAIGVSGVQENLFQTPFRRSFPWRREFQCQNATEAQSFTDSSKKPIQEHFRKQFFSSFSPISSASPRHSDRVASLVVAKR